MRSFITLACALVLGGGGCKDKTESAPPPAKAPAAAADPTPTPSPEPSPSAESSPTEQAPKPCAKFVQYAKGIAKLKVTGDVTKDFDFTDFEAASSGGPMDEGGITIMYRTSGGNERLSVSLGCEPGVSQRGIGNKLPEPFIDGLCTYEVKKLDATGVEGTLDCPKLREFSGKKVVKIVGTFSATP